MQESLKILFVEDSLIDTVVIQDELKMASLSFTSLRVETPEDFQAALQNEEWDIIFSDYNMPRFSALAAMEILQQSGFDIPFIIISGSIGEDLAVEALHKGADDYLMKDNLARLVPALERELKEVSERHTRKKVEALLLESESSYRRLVEGVKDYGIFMVDPSGKVLTWNMGAERILGYDAEEIIAEPFTRFLGEGNCAQDHLMSKLDAVALQSRAEFEVPLIRKDGQYFSAHNVITSVYGEQGTLIGFSIIVRDITERKQAEEENRRLAQELEQRVIARTAELELVNQELESFIHSVSHDLRAPLRNLVKLSKILKRYGEALSVEGQQYLEFIEDCGQQALELINALLDLSRVNRSPLRNQTIDLSALAYELAEELRCAEPKRQVEFKISPGLTAQGDTILMRVALQNLFENAWKYTAKTPSAVIEFFAEKIDDKIVFCLRDNGVGFDPAYSHKLFQAFQRLHPAAEFQGTGIGLATVQRVIHRHGGHIWAKGEVGKGATFLFYLASI